MNLICYELNEVPWRIVDLYVKLKPHSHLAAILENSCQLTTRTQDSGDLHPWTTWPTVHRGVYNDIHNIRFINQDIVTPYRPIWELLAKEGYRVGVFGSLQSWPIPDHLPFCFYIPDTFARDAQTYPQDLEVFQEFNLEQTQRDGAIAGRVRIVQQVPTLLRLVARGLRLTTVLRLGCHLVGEKLYPDYRTFRSILQAPVSFDFYWRLLNQHKPDFSTFFTNHVAGMMHRYWMYLFPEDFGYSLKTPRDCFLAQNIVRAMDIADQHIGRLKRFCDDTRYTLLIAGSMGQKAIQLADYCGELRIKDPDKFIAKLGFAGRVKSFMAMQPDFTFRCDTAETLEEFKGDALSLKNEKGESLFGCSISGLTIGLYLGGYSRQVIESQTLYREGSRLSIHVYGIDCIYRDQGTAYHEPDGIAIFYGQGIRVSDQRQKIASIQLLPTLLRAYQVPLGEYMAQPVETVLN